MAPTRPWDPARIVQLLAAGEDQWFERKSKRIEPRDLARTLVAFANAEGGLIAVGISQGRAEGLAGADQNALRQAARDFTSPPVRHTVELVEVPGEGSSTLQVMAFEVEASEYVHRTTGGDVYLRVGDENRRLHEFEVRELEYDKGQSSFDSRPVIGAGRDVLSEVRIAEYLDRLHVSTAADEVLEARGMLARKDGRLVPTTAGVLLFADYPQRFFPEAWVRVVEYRGRQREVGERSNVAADNRFEGPLTRQIEDVREYIRGRIPAFIRLGEQGRFAPTPLVPEHAWLEALVNSIIHRSYSMAGDHIRVELFDDRLEVESPGRLPGLVRVDNIRSTRFARNPRIARALSDLGFGRELGEGVDRMFQEMERAGLPDPVYEQRPASVRVMLLADPVLSRVLRALPPGQARLMDAISRSERATTTGLMALLGQSRPTVLKHLYALEELGLVEHVGAPRDPRGYWRARPEALQ